jgi:hypothetical protein
MKLPKRIWKDEYERFKVASASIPESILSARSLFLNYRERGALFGAEQQDEIRSYWLVFIMIAQHAQNIRLHICEDLHYFIHRMTLSHPMSRLNTLYYFIK